MYKVGYGKKTIEENIRVLMEEDGLGEERARAAVLKMARKAFQKAKPGADLPEYLRGEDNV